MEDDRYNKLKELVLASLNYLCEFEDEAKDRGDINTLDGVVKFFSIHSLQWKIKPVAAGT